VGGKILLAKDRQGGDPESGRKEVRLNIARNYKSHVGGRKRPGKESLWNQHKRTLDVESYLKEPGLEMDIPLRGTYTEHSRATRGRQRR